ncbi:Major facilitator superfamily [Kalmanozyma brasiliensis GHG001]|uniref:Major facilitator superfamily (MFS) profile domain-containing protein n=1 Tax=Kalmanozyma brasiliensis (strain GHG001) TaxID=1365824 RepID=V5GMT0_KALBG|nr:Major facilitator superfamily [Kalmanozyma brasiliensis GHG001]EST07272.1 Major facilitator superfamily [Kalmanozyma brasiliensis GHG001]
MADHDGGRTEEAITAGPDATCVDTPTSSYPPETTISEAAPPSYVSTPRPAYAPDLVAHSTPNLAASSMRHLPSSSTSTDHTCRPSLDTTHSSSAKSRLSARTHFLLVFSALCVSSFLSALDLTTVSTALPTIVSDLQNDAIRFGKHHHHSPVTTSTSSTGYGGTYIWIGAAYTVAGMAILPMTGGLCEIWGRKSVLLSSLFFFLFGSIICGASHSLEMMIVGRVLQGVGDGGIISLAEIIVADLVSLSERGTYEGILGVVWAGASAVGPPIGGVFSRRDHWRWLFWLNVPVTVLAIIMISCFMHMKTPQADVRSKLKSMDWSGNALLMLATVGLGLSLTWGGARYGWMSAPVLIPLVLSVLLFVAFFYLELFKLRNPTVPRELLSNRTAISAHLTSFAHGVVTMAIIYVIPTYFQAVKLSSTIMSGWMVLPFSCTVALTAIAFAVSIEVTQRYLPQNHLGWFFTVLGVPLLLLLDVDAKPVTWILVQLPIAIGCGILFVAPQFPTLASVAVELASRALALQLFFASFGQTLGIMLAEAVFQSSVHKAIKSPSIQALSANGSLPFNIEDISSPYSMHFGALRTLDPVASRAVRGVYSGALRHVWLLLIPFAVAGWAICFAMKELEMHDEVDERFAADVLDGDAVDGDREKGLLVDSTASKTKEPTWRTSPEDITPTEPSASMLLHHIDGTPTTQTTATSHDSHYTRQ